MNSEDIGAFRKDHFLGISGLLVEVVPFIKSFLNPCFTCIFKLKIGGWT